MTLLEQLDELKKLCAPPFRDGWMNHQKAFNNALRNAYPQIREALKEQAGRFDQTKVPERLPEAGGALPRHEEGQKQPVIIRQSGSNPENADSVLSSPLRKGTYDPNETPEALKERLAKIAAFVNEVNPSSPEVVESAPSAGSDKNEATAASVATTEGSDTLNAEPLGAQTAASPLQNEAGQDSNYGEHGAERLGQPAQKADAPVSGTKKETTARPAPASPEEGMPEEPRTVRNMRNGILAYHNMNTTLDYIDLLRARPAAAMEEKERLKPLTGEPNKPPEVNWLAKIDSTKYGKIVEVRRSELNALEAFAARATKMHAEASSNAHMHYTNSGHWKRRADTAESALTALRAENERMRESAASMRELLIEAQHMLKHTNCINDDATRCPACSLESRIESFQEEKS